MNNISSYNRIVRFEGDELFTCDDPGVDFIFTLTAIREAFTIDNCTDPVVTFFQNAQPGTDLETGTYTIILCATYGFGNKNCY